MTRSLSLLLLLFAVFAMGCGVDAGELGLNQRAPEMDPPRPGDKKLLEDCIVPVVPLGAGSTVDVLDASTLAKVASRMPCIADPDLVELLSSFDTMWYDRHSIVPGYQDSSGDNVTFPVGFRPNTIDPGLIVTGGHAAFFADLGTFHFPFGRPVGSKSDVLSVVDFWHVPRGSDGAILPVVWWQRQPNSFTWRYEWMFPAGTVLGEMLYSVDESGQWWPFEIRTRTRTTSGWTADTFRPFPTAAQFAGALEQARAQNPAWQSASDISALIAYAKDETSLVATDLSSPKLPQAFATIKGARDVLPPLADTAILKKLLIEQPFQSAVGSVWKTSGALATYAPTSNSSFHIVPRGYTGGFISVDDDSCHRCHVDAGHPFKDYHDFVYLYGELWGADEVFSWHPFDASLFVNADGTVKNFNNNNRKIRADFVAGAVVAPYQPALHPASIYQRLTQSWSDYSY